MKINKKYKFYLSAAYGKQEIEGILLYINDKTITIKMKEKTIEIPHKAIIKTKEIAASSNRELLELIISNDLRMSNANEALKKELEYELTITNPKWSNAIALGRKPFRISKTLHYYRELKNGDLKMPKGFIRMLCNLLDQKEIQYKIIDKTKLFDPIEYEFNGDLRKTQKKACHIGLKYNYSVLSAATGAGKTVMGINILSKRQQPTLIIVHTTNLLNQWIERIENFLNIPKEKLGLFGNGNKRFGNEITIGIINSLYNHVDDLKNRFGLVIVDECHLCPAKTFTHVLSHLNPRYMLGLSATPWRTDGLTNLIHYYLGSLSWEVPRDKLIERGEVLQTEVFRIETNFTTELETKTQYSKILAELVRDEERNSLVVNEIIKESKEHNGTILVLSDRKIHCHILHDLLLENGLESDILTSESDQERIINRLLNGQTKIIICTSQLIGYGFDYDKFNSLFLTTPIKSDVRIFQYVGRSLRPAEGKGKAKLFDFVDINIPTFVRQAAGRKKVYKKINLI